MAGTQQVSEITRLFRSIHYQKSECVSFSEQITQIMSEHSLPRIENMHGQNLWLTLDEIKQIHPIADAPRRRAEQAGLFPKRVMLSAHIPAWPRAEVEDWLRDPHSWQAKQVA
jgi:predicted DNA-binding transcriptional regulator AlpA